MGKQKSLRAKLGVLRVLKVAFYLLGFPLLLLLIKLDVDEFASGVLGNKAYFGLAIVAAGWAVVIVAQIVAALIAKKTVTKGIIAAIISIVVMIAPLAYIEFIIEDRFAELEEKYQYAEYEYEFEHFEMHTRDYKEDLEDHDAAVTRFLYTYNIEMEYQMFGMENTDLTLAIEDLDSPDFLKGFDGIPHYIFGKDEGGAVYSPNGLYADSYVFGMEQARYIFRTFYGAIDDFNDANYDTIDEKLADTIRKLNSDPDSSWNKYKQTDAYKRAYENDDKSDLLNAKNYYISIERLDSILKVLGTELSAYPEMQGLINLLSSQMGFASISLADLSLESITPLLEGFGLAEADLVGLLEGLSYYQSPSVYPVFFFIEDETLRDYAYAKYLGEVHGAKVASKLVSELPADPNIKLPNVGKLTIDFNGAPPIEKEELLKFLYINEIEAEFMPELYPYLTIRNFLFVFASVVPFTLLISYYFAALERRNFYGNLKLKEGAK
ncbi:MAG: hypothetical protein WC292_06775 [Clostridia bacterium]